MYSKAPQTNQNGVLKIVQVTHRKTKQQNKQTKINKQKWKNNKYRKQHEKEN